MKFFIEKPHAFWGILFLIPALIVTFINFKIYLPKINVSYFHEEQIYRKQKNQFRRLILRSVFFAAAWISLVSAYAGLSWGSSIEYAEKNGNAVSLVFDISFSMTANDAGGGISRLEAVKKYVPMLLSQIKNIPTSAIIAKGDGALAVPLTKDKNALYSLVDSLSPYLMSSAGSSLGKGIIAALNSFPKDSMSRNIIWVFTDGDETDGELENAVLECIKYGISVYIVGFGTEEEVKIISGDGKTPVMTALRAEKIQTILETAEAKKTIQMPYQKLIYINSLEKGSALKLLSPLKETAGEKSITTYGISLRKRYALFLYSAIIFFASAFIVSEAELKSFLTKNKKNSVILAIFCIFLLSSCSIHISVPQKILKGTWAWHKNNYPAAAAAFLQANIQSSGNQYLQQYAFYNLGTVYLMQNENISAFERFNQISQEAPESLRYAAFYNKGIAAVKQKNYTQAADFFKEALKIDSSRIEAKINLETAYICAQKSSRIKQNNAADIYQDENLNIIEEAVFQLIRENDNKTWKSSTESQNSEEQIDY